MVYEVAVVLKAFWIGEAKSTSVSEVKRRIGYHNPSPDGGVILIARLKNDRSVLRG
jgi:hypothetical protein